MNLERRHSTDNRRSREMEVERQEARLEKNRRRVADRRAQETQDEKESRREKERVRSAKRRSTSDLAKANVEKQARLDDTHSMDDQYPVEPDAPNDQLLPVQSGQLNTGMSHLCILIMNTRVFHHGSNNSLYIVGSIKHDIYIHIYEHIYELFKQHCNTACMLSNE